MHCAKGKEWGPVGVGCLGADGGWDDDGEIPLNRILVERRM